MSVNIDVKESIQETHSVVTSNCNKKTDELAYNYIQNTLDAPKKSQTVNSISYRN